jgi:hypothetical protein
MGEGMTDQGKFELLIDAVIRDGSISDKERGVILARGQELGYSQAEIEIILESRLSSASERSQTTVSFMQMASVEKCPKCGKDREPFLLQCLCKHWFSTARPNSTLGVFYQEMQVLDEHPGSGIHGNGNLNENVGSESNRSVSRRASLIAGIQIPNTKEDVLEIIALAVSQAEMPIDSDHVADSITLRNAWIAKGRQALAKASIFLNNEDDIKEFLSTSSARFESAASERRPIDRDWIWIVASLIGSALLVFLIITWDNADDNEARMKEDIEKLGQIEKKIDDAVSRKDFDQALVLAEKLVWTHDLDSEEGDMLQKQYKQKRESLKHTILKLRSER